MGGPGGVEEFLEQGYWVKEEGWHEKTEEILEGRQLFVVTKSKMWHRETVAGEGGNIIGVEEGKELTRVLYGYLHGYWSHQK